MQSARGTHNSDFNSGDDEMHSLNISHDPEDNSKKNTFDVNFIDEYAIWDLI